MQRIDRIRRVWLLCGVALAALFLLRTAGMVFQGALTGVGMYVAIMVAFSTFPVMEKLLYAFGGVSDLVVSFGLPALLSSVLGITGGTMMIGTIACGLLFTFTLKTKELGGPVRAATGTTSMITRNAMSSFEEWRQEYLNERLDQGRTGSRGGHHHDRGGREPQEAKAGGPRGDARGVIQLTQDESGVWS